jgi:hypothetical protein
MSCEEGDMSDRVQFDRIDYTIGGKDDVPVQRSCRTYYERFGDGRPAAQWEFEASRDFFGLLPAWLANLDGAAPSSFGSIRGLVSAGFYVGKGGFHGEGRAMDVDEITFGNAVIRPKAGQHASGDDAEVLRYIGLDAICRRHFPVVLDGWYNPDHADHIHAERVGVPLLQTGADSATAFCRQTCRRVFGIDVADSGKWDDKLQAAMGEAQGRIGVLGDLATDSGAWQEWLYAVAVIALKG